MRERERDGYVVQDIEKQGRKEATQYSYMSLSGAPNAIDIARCGLTFRTGYKLHNHVKQNILDNDLHHHHHRHHLFYPFIFYCLPCTCNEHLICIPNLSMKHIVWALYMCSRRCYKSLSKQSDNWPNCQSCLERCRCWYD